MSQQDHLALINEARRLSTHRPAMESVRTLFRFVDAQITRFTPFCRRCGRCCRFDEFGHRLYVTTVEFAYFLSTARLVRSIRPAGGTCPFLDEKTGRCRNRRARPLGCRIYFCQPETRWWQTKLYERSHRILKNIHERFTIEYRYADWLTLLDRAGDDIPTRLKAKSATPGN